MRPIHFLLALVVCVAWGLNAAAAKLGVTYVPPVFFTGLRFVFVLLFLLPWLRPVPGRWRVLVPAVFFMGGLHFALIFTGAKLSDASTMAIVNQLYVPISVLLALFWLGEAVHWRRWLGIAVAFAGVAVFSSDASVSSHVAGVLFLVADAVSMATGTVLLRKLASVPPFVMQAWMAALGVPFLFMTSALFESGQFAAVADAPWQAWAALAYTIVAGSLIGHTCYYILLQHYEVSLVGSVLLLSPAIGVIGGVTLLGEPFTPLIAVGSLVTLSGVGIVLMRNPQKLYEPAEGV
jgi:O-acetylserine/cysteine efflux transporter